MSHATPTWNIQAPDTQGIVGTYTSIALDVYGNPHISYQGYNTHNSTLKYASYNGNTWKIETVDSQDWTEGSYTSLVLDSAGYPHISYNNDHISQLKYARWTGSAWLTENVDSNGNAGSFTSLALDSHGNPCIAYHRGGQGLEGSLMYAHWTGSAWKIETVDPGAQGANPINAGQCCSLALDSADNPHISYLAGGGALNYASWTGSTWDIKTVATDMADISSSLILDSNGNPHISYVTYVPSVDFKNASSHPSYASWTGSAWNIEQVDLTTTSCLSDSLALDVNGNPYLSYKDYRTDGTSHLKYAVRTNSGWNIDEVDSSAADYPSIAVDTGGNPHISYNDPVKADLKYATFAESYQVEFSQTGSNNSTGTVLTVDSGNNYNAADLPVTFTWNKGTNHIFSYASPLNAGSDETYVWTGTSGLSAVQRGTLPITKSGNVSAQYQLQHPVSFSVRATTGSSATVDLSISGNVTSSQMSNVTIAANQSATTTTLSFTVTGESGTTGFSNVTTPKSAVTYGKTPTIYIDNQIAQDQGYTQDSNNYYVWYTTHFSTHEVSIVFTAPSSSPSPMAKSSLPPEAIYGIVVAAVIVAILAVVLVLRKKKKGKS